MFFQVTHPLGTDRITFARLMEARLPQFKT
jgi:hypothetical protein